VKINVKEALQPARLPGDFVPAVTVILIYPKMTGSCCDDVLDGVSLNGCCSLLKELQMQ
jgi:hypothetical protein